MFARFLQTTCSGWLPWHVTLCCNRTNYSATRSNKAPVTVATPSPVLTLSVLPCTVTKQPALRTSRTSTTKARYFRSPVNVVVKETTKSSNEHSPKNRRALPCGVGSLLRHVGAIYFWRLVSIFAVVPPQMSAAHHSSSRIPTVTDGLLTSKKYGSVTRVKSSPHQMFTFAVCRGKILT